MLAAIGNILLGIEYVELLDGGYLTSREREARSVFA